MAIAIVLIIIVMVGVLALILLRSAGGGRFPWLQFYLKGRESGFVIREINLLRRVSIEAKLENPTALFWSVKHLDRSIKTVIIKYRARSQEQDPDYNKLLAKLFELRKRVEFDQPKYKVGIKSSRKIVPKQHLRVTLPGLGPFASMVVENLARYLAVSHPQGPKLPEGFSWKNQRIGVYFWRKEDAGYYFQTKVLDDFLDRKYPILHIAHSENLVRAQKRHSVRVETDLPAELYPLKTIDVGAETPESSAGLRCRIADLSEGGVAILIGGKAKVGLPLKVQFYLGDNLVVLSGVVKGVNFDQAKNRSMVHVQAAPPSILIRNRIHMYVYNLFGERDTGPVARNGERPARPAEEGIVLKASPPASGFSATPKARAETG